MAKTKPNVPRPKLATPTTNVAPVKSSEGKPVVNEPQQVKDIYQNPSGVKYVKKYFDDNDVELSEGDAKITKVIAYLEGSESATATKIGIKLDEARSNYNKFAKEVKTIQYGEAIPYMEQLFNVADAAYTRIVDTAGLVMQMPKEAKDKQIFDKEKFFKEISKQLPEMVDIIKKIYNETSKVSKQRPNVSVKKKNESVDVNEGIGDSLKSAFVKVKEWISAFVKSANKSISEYDKKLAQWKKEIAKNIQTECHNVAINRANRFIDIFMD